MLTLHPGEHETYLPGGNRLPPRAVNNRSNAKSYTLNGIWRFRLSPTAAVDEEFAQLVNLPGPENSHLTGGSGWRPGDRLPSRSQLQESSHPNKSSWGNILVPAHWVLQGYGLPAYQNINLPFPCDPPFVPTENPTGDYLRSFDLPEDFAAAMSSGTTRLRFDGVESWFKVWLNGTLLGWSTGSRLPTEFHITPHLRTTSNMLAVRVHQWSAATYLEDQDQWWLPGIFRDVTICHRPVDCVVDFTVLAEFDHRTATGTLRVDCNPGGLVKIPELGVSSPTGVSVTLRVEPWSAETPRLYLGVLQTKGESVPLSVGFRTVEISDGLIKVNGRRVHLKGVNRHEFHPYTGRTMDVETMLQDIRMMKQFSFNAVRTSHYPPDHRFLELCDEHGLWVMDEVDFETHGFCREPHTGPGWKNNITDDPRFAQAIIDRAERTVLRDRNRCSVIIWSMGNEAGFGQNITPMVGAVRNLDSSRPIHYEGDRDCYNVDIYSLMYKSHAEMELLGRGEEPAVDGDPKQDAKRRKMPFLLQEYAHAMGNGPGGLSEYRDLFERYPRLQGGFVWEWMDHGFPALNDDNICFWAYGGDFGEEVHDGNFICDGMLFPDRKPSPSMIEYKKVFQPLRFALAGSQLEISNLQDFATTANLALSWLLEEGGKAIGRGELDMPLLDAGMTGMVDLPDMALETSGERFLTIRAYLSIHTSWAHRGHVLAMEQFPLSASTRQVENPRCEHDAQFQGQTVVFGPAVFDRLTGALLSVGHLPVKDFRLEVWRAPIDNDHKGLPLVNKSSVPDRPVPGLDKMKTRLDQISSEKGVLRVTTRLAPVTRQLGLRVTYTYTISTGPTLNIAVHVKPEGDWGEVFLPRLGVSFGIGAKHSLAKWFGLGPGESYPDSRAGSHIGLWSMTVDEMQTNYAFPQENGSRMNVRWAELGEASEAKSEDNEARGLRILGSPHFCFTARRWTSEDLYAAKHTSDLIPTETVWINVDHRHHGLGSAACGPPTLREYELKPEETEFQFSLRPL